MEEPCCPVHCQAFLYCCSATCYSCCRRGPMSFLNCNPAWRKKTPMIKMLPGNTEIIQVMGHNFRKDDACVPFYVTFSWENHYDRDDGYSHYSLQFKQTFAGELWYSTDKQEFTLTVHLVLIFLASSSHSYTRLNNRERSNHHQS